MPIIVTEAGIETDASLEQDKKAHAPIAIVTTRGTERVLRELFWKRTDVSIELVEIIDAETVAGKKPDELADYARSVIEQNLSK